MNHCFDRIRVRVQEELDQGTLFEMHAPWKTPLGHGDQ